MVTPRWRKVLSDLWGNKVRSLLVVLSIAVGVFAVGLVAGSYVYLRDDITADYLKSNPRDAVIYTDLFDDDFLESLRKTEGVGQVQGLASVNGQVTLNNGQKAAIELQGVPASLDDMQINRLRLERGAPLLPDKHLYIERNSLGVLGLEVGDTVRVLLPGDRVRELTIAGVVHDVSSLSYAFTQTLFGYVTPETLEWLGGTRQYNRLLLTTAVDINEEAFVLETAERVADKIEKSGRQVYVTVALNPGLHPAQTIVDAILALNSGLGILILFLSTFLVINTISALLSQQVRQIGVMKAVGADSGQVMRLYLVLILLFSVVALALAIPAGGVAAYFTGLGVTNMLNVNLAGFRFSPLAVTLQVAVGLLVPLLASLVPIYGGSRLTVREAISNYGLSAGGRRTFFDAILESGPGLPRPLLISLRNTFRRKARLALTLSTLTLGGAIFMAVLNVQDSMYAALDVTFGYILSDVNVDFTRAYRMDRIRDVIKDYGKVVGVEGWGGTMAEVMNPDGMSGDQVSVLAPPATSKMIKPVLSAGRWLVPEDQNALVVGNHFVKVRPETRVGETVNLRIQNKDYPFKIVGIYKMAGNVIPPILYVNFDYLSKLTNEAGQVYSIRVDIEGSDFQEQLAFAKVLESHFKEVGMQVGGVVTGGQLIQQNRMLVDIIILILMMMALLIAVVGGIGMMGTMSMNVLERTREIGVMRSIGAVNRSIMQLVVTEGVFIGLISWGLGALMAVPMTHLLDNLVGVSILNVPLDYIYSPKGLLIWLVIVVVLSAISSLIPARNAVRLTVRDVLAYE